MPGVFGDSNDGAGYLKPYALRGTNGEECFLTNDSLAAAASPQHHEPDGDEGDPRKHRGHCCGVPTHQPLSVGSVMPYRRRGVVSKKSRSDVSPG